LAEALTAPLPGLSDVTNLLGMGKITTVNIKISVGHPLEAFERVTVTPESETPLLLSSAGRPLLSPAARGPHHGPGRFRLRPRNSPGFTATCQVGNRAPRRGRGRPAGCSLQRLKP
jgi:hypothetical protein